MTLGQRHLSRTGVKKQVGIAKPLLEPDRVIFLQRANELDHEFLGRHRDNSGAAISSKEGMTDGMQKMGFAAAGSTVNEQRIEADRR